MEGRLLLKGCSLFRADGRVRAGMSVLVEGRTIAAVAPDAELPVRPGDWEVRCGGRLVTTGLVDCHTRLVGGQLTPWAGDLLLRPFLQRFAQEQALEARLSVGEVEALTAFAAARCLRSGITMAVEHLHAPACVEPALEAQARVARRLGLRLVTAHASSSTVGGVPGPAQVEANARFAAAQAGDPLVRGAIGLRASFCADDDLLRVAGQVKEELALGVHVGVAEHDEDLALTWERHGARVVTRLERFGLLGGASVAAHAWAIDRHEAERLAKTRTLVALTPRGALAVAGGSALGMEAVLVGQNIVGLGTNGSGTLWEELAASYTGVMALSRVGRMLDPDNLMAGFFVGGPAELCTMIFGTPSGTVEPGALADLIVSDMVPPRETGNFTPHLLMQLSQAPVGWVIVDGRVVVREGQLLGADYLELAHQAAQALESAWRRSGVSGGGAAPQ